MRFLKIAKFIFLVGFLLFFLFGIFFTVVVIRDNSYFDSINERTFDDQLSTEENVIRLMDWIYFNSPKSVDKENVPLYVIIEGLSPFRYSARSIIDYGYYVISYYGTCGSMTRVALVLLRRKGIPTRKLQLVLEKGSHTMPVVFIDGKWRVFDVSHNFYWVNHQGQIATLEEIKNVPGMYEQIQAKRPTYGYSFERSAYIRWRKFGRFGVILSSLLEKIFGKDFVAEIDTPHIYERPRIFYTYLSYILSVFFLFIFIGFKRKLYRFRNK